MRTPRPPRCHATEPQRISEEFASDSIFREKCSGENLSVLASCHWHLPLCSHVFTYKPVRLHHSFWWDNHPPHLILDKQDPNSKLQATVLTISWSIMHATRIRRKVAAGKDPKSWERGIKKKKRRIILFLPTGSLCERWVLKSTHRDGMGQDWISHPHFLMTFL